MSTLRSSSFFLPSFSFCSNRTNSERGKKYTEERIDQFERIVGEWRGEGPRLVVSEREREKLFDRRRSSRQGEGRVIHYQDISFRRGCCAGGRVAECRARRESN